MATTPADILVRAVMTGSTGLPADTYVNDFAFHFIAGTTPTDANLLTLFGAVDGFYNDTVSSTYELGNFISQAVSRSVTHEMQFFTISSGPLGSPRLIEPWLGPVAPVIVGANLPGEVAGCLSFHADLTGVQEESGATRPRARRRGRVYLGPLIVGATSQDIPDPVLSPTFTTVMRAAATHMFDEAEAGGWAWSVWSREDNILRPVVGGWTDNAPDTQRRRGISSTARVTFVT